MLISEVSTKPQKKVYVCGKVIYGEQKGRAIGFPTANLDFYASWLEIGVYGVTLLVKNKRYFGLMNIGVKPTFQAEKSPVIEIHILNFSQMIYGQMIESEILFKIRDEQKFPSVHELISQIKADIAYGKQRFNQLKDL